MRIDYGFSMGWEEHWMEKEPDVDHIFIDKIISLCLKS